MDWTEKYLGKILGGLLRVAVDFVIFWGIFLWNDGAIWKYVTLADTDVEGNWFQRLWIALCRLVAWLASWIWMLLQKLWVLLIFLSPYSRMAAMAPDFRYCLHWCSGCVVIFAICSFCFCLEETDSSLLSTILVTIAASFALWYIGFAACFFLVKISTMFMLLAPAAMVVLCVIAGFLLLCVEEIIFE